MRTARVSCSRRAFVGTIARERRWERSPPRVRTGSPRLSPDQASLMVAITDATTAQPDLWQLALARGTMSRVTSDQSSDWFPVWSPDGSRVFFGSARTGSTTIFQKSGVSPAELFSDSFLSVATYPNDVSGDGRFLVYQQFASGGYNLGVIPLSGDRKPMPFVAGPSNEVQGRFSPNSRWIAYASDESGQFEVYVRPFPAQTTQSTTISIGGGMQPEWRRDGKELFYISADGKLTAVPVVTDQATFTRGHTARALRRRSPRGDRSVPNRLCGHRRWPALPRQHRRRSADAPGADGDPQLDGSPEQVKTDDG